VHCDSRCAGIQLAIAETGPAPLSTSAFDWIRRYILFHDKRHPLETVLEREFRWLDGVVRAQRPARRYSCGLLFKHRKRLAALSEAPVPSLERGIRPLVFISYSPADREWLDRLLVHLRPREHEGLVDIWDDTRLMAGTRWREEIEAVLLSKMSTNEREELRDRLADGIEDFLKS
jgi:hypothetical protein